MVRSHISTGAFLAALVFFTGCATYHPLPLDKKAEEGALASPNFERITVEAAQIHHPLLKPVHIDLSRGFTPEELGVVAVLCNPDLRAIRDERGLARAQVIQAGLLPNPVASYGQDRPTGGSDQGTVTGYSTQLGFDLTSLLTYSLRKEAARAQAQAVDLDIAWQEWQVAQAARMAAYHLLAIEEELPLAEGAMAEARKSMDAMVRAAGTGAASGQEEASARESYGRARETALLLEQAEIHERQRINQLLGLPPDDKIELREGMALPAWDDLPSRETLVDEMGERRLDLLALKKGYESQDHQLRIAIRSQFPNIGIDLSHARDTGNVVTTGYGIAIQLPIFDRNQGRIAYETATRQQLHDEYLARLFNARADVAQILSDLETIRRRIETIGTTLPSLRETAEGYQSALRMGAADLPAAQAADSAYLSAASELIRLRSEKTDLGLALEIATGRYLPEAVADEGSHSEGGRP